MHGAEIFGGSPHATGATRIEAMPDSNRGPATNISPLAQAGSPLYIGAGGGPVQGPFIQNAESTDYTIYVTRTWSGPEASDALLRDASLRLDVGAGSALKRTTVVPLISPAGLAYHVVAQTVRMFLDVTPVNPGQHYFVNDFVNAWIARGRPFTQATQSTQLVGTANRAEIPAFARYVTVGQQTPGMFTPATATINFLDVDGTTIQSVPLTGIVLGQRLPVYMLAAYVTLSDVNALARGVLTWECEA